MRISLAALLLVASLLFGCNLTRGKPYGRETNSSVNNGTAAKELGITKEAAIRTATDGARKKYGLANQFTVIPCEQIEFWRIIFEPNNGTSSHGPEYLLDKKTGSIVSDREILLGEAETNSEIPATSRRIEREAAIAIGRKDAITAYGASAVFDLTTCELSRSWRIIFSPKQGLNGGGPEYVIDKSTGTILEKKYYQ